MNYNSEIDHSIINIVVVWCRNRMNYNLLMRIIVLLNVVVWCRNRMNYNTWKGWCVQPRLWFDVEIEWITTIGLCKCNEDVVVVWCRNRMNYNTRVSFWCCSCVVVWCRNRMNYNRGNEAWQYWGVVVWCRNRMNYNSLKLLHCRCRLWFDVEIEWITTSVQTLHYLW